LLVAAVVLRAHTIRELQTLVAVAVGAVIVLPLLANHPVVVHLPNPHSKLRKILTTRLRSVVAVLVE